MVGSQSVADARTALTPSIDKAARDGTTSWDDLGNGSIEILLCG